MVENERSNVPSAEFHNEQLRRFTRETLRAKQAGTFDIGLLNKKIGQGKRVIALDLGGSNLRYAEFTVGSNMELCKTEAFTFSSENGEKYLNFLRDVGEFAQENSLPVGISTTGIVEGTRLRSSTHLKKLIEDLSDVQGDFSSIIPNLKSASNDGVAGAIGSYAELLRKFPAIKQVIYFINGTGLGAAVIQEGKIWSTEPGHIETIDALDPYKRKKLCSLAGVESPCIHLTASGHGIEDTYFKITGKKATGIELSKLAQNGDETAQQLLRNSAGLVAITLEGIMNSFQMEKSPEDTAVIFHGGIFNTFEYNDYLKQSLRTNLANAPQLIFPNNEEENFCLIGAALTALAI